MTTRVIKDSANTAAGYFFPKTNQPNKMPRPKGRRIGIHIQLFPRIASLPGEAPPPKNKKITTTAINVIISAALIAGLMTESDVASSAPPAIIRSR